MTERRTMGAESCAGAETTSDDTSHGDNWLKFTPDLALAILAGAKGEVGLEGDFLAESSSAYIINHSLINNR